MKEKTIVRNGEQVTEVRSHAGKLLYVKTKEGYEIKCPRSKQICLIRYEAMFRDCLGCLDNNETAQMLEKILQFKKGKP